MIRIQQSIKYKTLVYKHQISLGSHPKIFIHQLSWHSYRRIVKRLTKHSLLDQNCLMFKLKIYNWKTQLTKLICVRRKTERCWWLRKKHGNIRQSQVSWIHRILAIIYLLSWLVTNIWSTNRRNIQWVILVGHQCHQWLEFQEGI